MKSRQAKRLSAGIIITRLINDQRQFLLLRAFNYWDFPKGMVEHNESPFSAAKREVAEETSLNELVFPWGKGFFETPPYSQGKVARYYLAETAQSQVRLLPNPETGRAEHVEYRWVSYQQAMALVSPRVRKVLQWAATRL
ncbi:MAG: NUDIX domain-containing protein [Gammaproteobacteria bacterium]